MGNRSLITLFLLKNSILDRRYALGGFVQTYLRAELVIVGSDCTVRNNSMVKITKFLVEVEVEVAFFFI